MTIQQELQAAFEKRAAQIDHEAAIVRAEADRKQHTVDMAAAALENAFEHLEADRNDFINQENA